MIEAEDREYVAAGVLLLASGPLLAPLSTPGAPSARNSGYNGRRNADRSIFQEALIPRDADW
jgi:hypothetical protein